MPDLVIVKLGGSLITDKRGEARLRDDVLSRLAGEIASGLEGLEASLIVTHGSGSFGHVAAKKQGYQAGGRLCATAVAEIQLAAHRLHGLVHAALLEAGIACYSVVPSGFFVSGMPGDPEIFERPLRLALELGFVPVTGGDVVLHPELRGTIVSTESLLLALVESLDSSWFRVRRVLWLGETEGIFDLDGRTIPFVDDGNIEAVLAAVGETAGTDVTGGMRLRVQTASKLASAGISSQVLNGLRQGCLEAALRGHDAGGTCFLPEPSLQR